jgi:hypothetical protein
VRSRCLERFRLDDIGDLCDDEGAISGHRECIILGRVLG